jgi:hypothetical protein
MMSTLIGSLCCAAGVWSGTTRLKVGIGPSVGISTLVSDLGAEYERLVVALGSVFGGGGRGGG